MNQEYKIYHSKRQGEGAKVGKKRHQTTIQIGSLPFVLEVLISRGGAQTLCHSLAQSLAGAAPRCEFTSKVNVKKLPTITTLLQQDNSKCMWWGRGVSKRAYLSALVSSISTAQMPTAHRILWLSLVSICLYFEGLRVKVLPNVEHGFLLLHSSPRFYVGNQEAPKNKLLLMPSSQKQGNMLFLNIYKGKYRTLNKKFGICFSIYAESSSYWNVIRKDDI